MKDFKIKNWHIAGIIILYGGLCLGKGLKTATIFAFKTVTYPLRIPLRK